LTVHVVVNQTTIRSRRPF